MRKNEAEKKRKKRKLCEKESVGGSGKSGSETGKKGIKGEL